jgi:SulP family sulfate permease
MANAVLTGVSPVRGLYALMAGTSVASLTTSSEYLTVVVTAAMAVAVGDALAGVPSDQRVPSLVTLTILIGVITVALGLLRAGTLMRFVPNAVMRGFLTGVAVNIVLGQIPAVTGTVSDAPGRVSRSLEILSRPMAMDVASLALAALTLVVVLGVERTRLRRFAMTLALLAVAAFANAAVIEVQQVGDIGTIPAGLPQMVLPEVRTMLYLLLPAASVAIIGLIQTAGISKNTPNRGGRYPEVSRDFVGQGLGNIASGLIGGIPVGGSVSGTSLNVQAGARTRLSNFIIGPIIVGLVLLFAEQVEAIPMPVLAALLITVGVRSIDGEAIRAVGASSRQSAVIMAVTFAGTLLIPIQYAVMLGIGLTVVRHVYAQGLDARIVGIELTDDGRLAETAPPTKLEPYSVTAIEAYGSLAFAGAQALQDSLPDPSGARGAIMVLRLRGQEGPGSTLVEVLRRYRGMLDREDATLMLAGVGEALRTQLERTGIIAEVGRENVFYSTQVITDSTVQAIVEAQRRVRELR